MIQSSQRFLNIFDILRGFSTHIAEVEKAKTPAFSVSKQSIQIDEILLYAYRVNDCHMVSQFWKK